jgi:hypothetical protein
VTASRFPSIVVASAGLLALHVGGCRPRVVPTSDGAAEASTTTLASAELPGLPSPASLGVPGLLPPLVACREPVSLVPEDPASVAADFEADEEDPLLDQEERRHRLDITDLRGNFQVREPEALAARRQCEVWSRNPRGRLARVDGYHCSFSVTGRYLDGYRASEGKEELVRWDLQRPLDRQAPLRFPGSVRLSPDDRTALRLDDATLLRWSTGKVVAVRLPEAYDTRRLQADHCGDGRIFATWDARVLRVHRASGAIVARLRVGPADGWLSFSTDGRHVAVVDKERRRPIVAARLE